MSTDAPTCPLEVRGAARFYGPRLIFRNVSHSFPASSVTLLLGANGAGKSTLLRLLAGLSRPAAGEVICRAEASKVAFLGHETCSYAALTALENMMFWGRLYGCGGDEDDALAVLERVGLGAVAHEKAGTFSRGMAQRLNLARVLRQRADVLLLDEPSTGLDMRSVAVLRREISEARDRGACVVWISHDAEHDAEIADAALVLESRQALAFSDPAEAVEYLRSGGAKGQPC